MPDLVDVAGIDPSSSRRLSNRNGDQRDPWSTTWSSLAVSEPNRALRPASENPIFNEKPAMAVSPD